MIDKDADTTLKFLITILFRTGFILIHIGCVPTTNANYIYIQHILNAFLTTATFWFIGHGVALGKDYAGLVGGGTPSCWFGWDHKHAIFFWMATMYSSALVQLVTAGRAHLIGDCLVSVINAGLVHPLVMHWTWTPGGWMIDNNNSTKSNTYIGPFIDFSGGNVIHLYGGAFSLGAMIILGQRVINVSSLDPRSLAVNSQVTTLLGYMIISVCTILLSSWSPYWPPGNIQTNLVKSTIGFSMGLLMVALIGFITCQRINYSVLVWMIQGGLAGLVALSSTLSFASPLAVILMSSVASIIYLAFSTLIRVTGFEDYTNTLSIYVVPGGMSAYYSAFNRIGKNNTEEISAILLWQGLCSFIIFSVGISSSLAMYSVLFKLKMLRNKPEREIQEDSLTLQANTLNRIHCCLNRVNQSTVNMLQPRMWKFLPFKKRRMPQQSQSAEQENNLEDQAKVMPSTSSAQV